MSQEVHLQLEVSNESLPCYFVYWSLKPGESFRIGRKRRGSDVDLQIDNVNASLQHVRIGNDYGQIFIEDISRSGTFLGGKRFSGKKFLNEHNYIKFSSSLSISVTLYSLHTKIKIKNQVLQEIESGVEYHGCTFYLKEDTYYNVVNSQFDNCTFRGNFQLQNIYLCKFTNCGFNGKFTLVIREDEYCKKSYEQYFPFVDELKLSLLAYNGAPFEKTLLQVPELSLELSFQRSYDSSDIMDKISSLKNLIEFRVLNPKYLTPDLSSFSNLKRLQLKMKDGDYIPLWVSKMKKLECLDVSGNNLNTLLPDMDVLYNLKSLSLADNNFKELPVIVSKMQDLEILNISGNCLHTLPNFSCLQNLQSLILENNGFTQVPLVICKMSKLKNLDMSNNHLETMSEICSLQNLKCLKVNNNHISEIPSCFCEMKQLEAFFIEDNNLQVIPDVSSLENLHTMFVHGNNITEVSSTVREKENLRFRGLHRQNL